LPPVRYLFKVSGHVLREAQRIGKLGCYIVDVPSGMWTSSEELDEIFGIGDEYDRTVTGRMALIHPDDRAKVGDKVVEDVAREGKDLDSEYRIVGQTGSSGEVGVAVTRFRRRRSSNSPRSLRPRLS
jgi:PAS fold